MKKGFTLFELLIALAVSAVVASGLFSMFSTVAGVRNRSLNESENIILKGSISRLVNRDTRMMIDNTLAVDSSEDIRKLKFSTQNSLRFNKALPAEVTYYIDDKNWLVRRETNTDVLYDMEMRLIPNATDMEIEFYNGSEYQEELVKGARMIKITFTVNGSPLTVLAVRTVENS